MALAVGAAECARRLLAPAGAPPTPVPVDLSDHFTAAEIDRGRRFARPQRALALGRAGLELALLAALARRPPPALARGRSLGAAAAASAGLSVALALQSLPLRAISRHRSRVVGLDTQAWREWALDVVKATAIGSSIAAGAGVAVTAAARRFPRAWWAPAAAGSVAFGAGVAALAPVLLDPIFNSFTPLPEGETRSDVLSLARDAGIRVGGVYSVDASRRTTAANAYVTGLGPSRRVVLFDTLLDRFSRDEIRLVVAHELAHVRHRDVLRGLGFAAIVAPAAALGAQRLSWTLSPHRADGAALPALALSAALVSAPVGLVANALSRAIERRADHFSLTLAGAPEAFVSFERAIALQNVADLDPPRWVARLLATHPTTAERIGAAVAFANATVGVSP